MFLIEAITMIADSMENDGNDPSMKDTFGGQFLRSYAKQIRRLIKASESSQLVEKPNWEQEAREEFHKKNVNKKIEMVGLEDGFLGQQLEIVDGPLSGDDGVPTFGDVPPGGIPGCKVVLGGRFVYRLGDDNKLHFLIDETDELIKAIEATHVICKNDIVLGN